MKQHKLFNSQIKKIKPFATDINNDVIKNETMFFNSDLKFAYNNGGEITKSFIENLPIDWILGDVVFDSRVHMLMKDWYPCIPGWHHDDVPRTNNGQPDYDNQHYFSEHILGVVNSDICPTKFALGEVYMPPINEGEIVYNIWNNVVESEILEGNLRQVNISDRILTYLDCNTFHTGQKALTNGWRWFGRISRNTDRTKAITNEIRVNAQVYLEFPTKGW